MARRLFRSTGAGLVEDVEQLVEAFAYSSKGLPVERLAGDFVQLAFFA
jgi:hypothetical protein